MSLNHHFLSRPLGLHLLHNVKSQIVAEINPSIPTQINGWTKIPTIIKAMLPIAEYNGMLFLCVFLLRFREYQTNPNERKSSGKRIRSFIKNPKPSPDKKERITVEPAQQSPAKLPVKDAQSPWVFIFFNHSKQVTPGYFSLYEQ